MVREAGWCSSVCNCGANNAAGRRLKRNIVVHRRLIAAHAHLVAGTGIRLLRQAGAASATKKLNPLCDDLGN
jgi:hypothetical protein